jgi:hypothetical protein
LDEVWLFLRAVEQCTRSNSHTDRTTRFPLSDFWTQIACAIFSCKGKEHARAIKNGNSQRIQPVFFAPV